MMLSIDAQTVAGSLPYAELTDVLDEAFRLGAEVPHRERHEIIVPGSVPGTVIIMPAWQTGRSLGIKIVSIFPGNSERGKGSVNASYLLLDANTGEPAAILDGDELTLRRTAAASALASRYLSRPDASRMLMVGAGTLAPHLIRAHASARDITEVTIWARRKQAADSLVADLSAEIFRVSVADDLESAARTADIVSCATLATEPLVRGEWLQPGQHIDLVGAFRPDMHEVDGEAVARAQVFVDTYAGTMSESGEIVSAIAAGILTEAGIAADLAELASGAHMGRESKDDITLFKSVGTALEDLAAAGMVVNSLRDE